MKKTIALLLALLLALSLVACAKDTPAPAATPTPAATPDTSGGEDIATLETPSGDTTAFVENAIGAFSSGVDPASRDTYEIVWAYMRPMALFQNIHDALTSLEDQLNFKTTAYCANSDIDAMIQNIEIYADQGVDGFMVVIDPTAVARTKAVLDATGVPYIAMLNSARDENGSEIVPCIGIDGVEAGAATIDWLADNYKTYWGDIDTAELGLLNFNFSPNADFNDRHNGSLAAFEKRFPGNKTFTADGVSGKLDEQTGYDLASAIMAANPDIKYWFVAGCIELYSQGAARAVEAMSMDDRVLITAVGSDVLPAEWDNGYSGSWVSCLALSQYQYAMPGISALIAMMDGKITAEELWADRRLPTDQVTFYNVAYGILTKENYEEFFAQVLKDAGLA